MCSSCKCLQVGPVCSWENVMDPIILVDGLASLPVWSTEDFYFIFGLFSLFACFLLHRAPVALKCSLFNLCGKLGLAIDLQRGVIVPCEPWGQSAREERGDNKQFLLVFCSTVM